MKRTRMKCKSTHAATATAFLYGVGRWYQLALWPSFEVVVGSEESRGVNMR